VDNKEIEKKQVAEAEAELGLLTLVGLGVWLMFGLVTALVAFAIGGTSLMIYFFAVLPRASKKQAQQINEPPNQRSCSLRVQKKRTTAYNAVAFILTFSSLGGWDDSTPT
jgi:hypothetical protein